MKYFLLTIDEKYMFRCVELARLGSGYVAPNPMVGAVLVRGDKIIGEGYHQKYGEAHAEMNALSNMTNMTDVTDMTNMTDVTDMTNMTDVTDMTLYVSLEPCTHHGKTPPCTDLIIKNKIPKVVIGSRDPNKEVQGKGIEKLRAAGIKVEAGILEKECKELNKRFFTFHEQHRPYIILKWAQTEDGFIASGKQRLKISNEFSNQLVHKWRSEEAGILIGTKTALLDDPALTTRSWPGESPVRLVLDMDLKLPASLRIFDQKTKTIIFNASRQEQNGNLTYYKLKNRDNILIQLLDAIWQLEIQSVLVEGGAKLLQSFIDAGIWDEIRVIVNKEKKISKGLPAPIFHNAAISDTQQLSTDELRIYLPKRAGSFI